MKARRRRRTKKRPVTTAAVALLAVSSTTTTASAASPPWTSSVAASTRTTSLVASSSVITGTLIPRGGGDTNTTADPTRDQAAAASTTKPSPTRRKKKKSNKGKQRRKDQHDKDVKDSVSKEQSSKDDKDEKPSSSTPAPPSDPLIQEILAEDDYYRILGLQSRQHAESHPRAIQKAYRRRAVRTHPDKTGGDRRAFDKVAEAYDVLSDDEKRSVYHRFGKAGLERHKQTGSAGGAGMMAEELFRSFFGAGSSSSYFSPPRRNRTARYQLEVTLEDLYRGVERSVLAAAPSSALGGRAAPASKRVDVHIPRGAASGQSVTVSGAMDFDADDTPGDVIFGLLQRPHPVFARKGHDLCLTLQVSLKESICGVERTIQHLDGKKITLVSARRQHHAAGSTDKDVASKGGEADIPVLIQSGDVQVLKGRGMPMDEVGTQYGDLYVQYQVEMPKSSSKKKMSDSALSLEEREELGRLLDKLEGKTHSASDHDKKKAENVQYLEPSSIAEFGRTSGRHFHHHGHDDHHPHGPDEEFEGGFSPFGNARRQFFHFGTGSGAHHFFGHGASHPFGNDDDDAFQGGDHDDHGNVQCQQM